jgi:hypothetical protein
MINYTQKYFDLKILRIKDIKLHETTETNRLRNIFDRIAKDRKLMNPVIIGKHNDTHILIDGANRLSSLEEIGCKLALAQIIDYKNKRIRLKNWNHLIYDFDIDIIREYCEKHKLECKILKYSEGHQIFKKNHHSILATEIKNEKSILIYLPKSINDLIKELNKFTKIYFNIYPFDRSETEIKISDLKKHSRRNGILIEYPLFKKRNIIDIAEEKYKHKIPAGITRHILINRVLHVRYDLKNLFSDNNIETKTKDLENYLIKKIDNNKVRQYIESVIVFDE